METGDNIGVGRTRGCCSSRSRTVQSMLWLEMIPAMMRNKKRIAIKIVPKLSFFGCINYFNLVIV